MRTVSGDLDHDFPMNYVNGMFVYGDAAGDRPVYSITSVSGDVTLERY